MKQKQSTSFRLHPNVAKAHFLLCALFILVGIPQLSYAQEKKIRISQDKTATVDQVFEIINKQTNYRFIYKANLFENLPPVQLKKGTTTVQQLLQQTIPSEDFSLYFKDNTIEIAKIEKAPKTTIPQKITLQGKVIESATNLGIPGVNVTVKGQPTEGVATDIEGNYTLSVSKDAVLIFSAVGMKTIEIPADKASKVVMQEDTSLLDEVVVVGYGTQKKINLTGAVSSVIMNDLLKNRPITNTLNALQGALPGVQITTKSGQPGDRGLNINIRGFTSINGGEPLLLLDNVPVNSEDINPQDIESVSVLKDASASAIYGARAAFGVVLITTKKGKRNQPIQFNYSTTLSINSPTDIPKKASVYDFINAIDSWGVENYWTGQNIDNWVSLLNKYRSNPFQFPNAKGKDQNGVIYPLKETDLLSSYFGDEGFSQIHNFSFNGGSKSSIYRVSLGYSNEDGIIVTKNDSYEKYNLKAFLKTDLTSKLSSSIDVGFRRSNLKQPIGSYWFAINAKPWIPIEGNHVFEDGKEVPYQTPINAERLNTPSKTLINNIRIQGALNYKIIKNLNLTGEYTFETGTTSRKSQNSELLTVDPERLTLNGVTPENTYYRKSNLEFAYKTLNLYAKYKKTSQNHHFELLAGINNESYETENIWVRKKGLISIDLPSISTATGIIESDDSFNEWAILGGFGRINYNYDERYFIELSGRYDGSSKFPTKSRFGFFPSFSIGWNISNEPFLKNIKNISLLKLRASFGEIGNQKVGNYEATPGMPVYPVKWLNPNTGLPYNSIDVPALVSSNFTWEKVRTTNLGIDFALLNNKLASSFNWFTRETIGMLTKGAQLPDVLGSGAPRQNAADLKSTGWELELKWRDKINDFKYSLGVSIFDSQAEITKFKNEAGLLNQYYVGRKIGEIWGYVTDGYYSIDDFVENSLDENLMNGKLKDGLVAFKGKNPNPGDVKFKNLNNDNEISQGDNTLSNPGDRKIIGNSTRRYQFGVFGAASYKNFDFSFALNGVGKRDVWINSNIRFPYRNEFETMFSHQTDYWTPSNTDAYYPRNYDRGGINYSTNIKTQTKYLLNGAYINIKNITLGYTMPKSFLKKIHLNNLRINASVENLYNFNNWPKGINTELTAKSGNGGMYPLLRTFSLGLNITF